MILDPADMELGQAAGLRRHARRRAAGSGPQWGLVPSAQLDIEAVQAEIACARHLGLTWVETDMPDKDGDLGPGIQVRHTRHPNGRLLLHPTDENNHRFYLVTGTPPELTVRGWIMGGDGKHPDLWVELRPGQPCFAVPQEMLSRPRPLRVIA